ncbi:gamma-aminobutyric acid receptor subunit beta-like isoform X2 [Cylas formicarius]|uniref:gamma-aminobutyric acid receptor subunit beta-like isoform X2 n=1 Tax=Cylas formicarius TaxID=197179 RepID=UPI0029585874|nr:gamma-aminobutyric acid receptor subunit beta-like isoform X2 [Cylas formicarius]XP_060530643.1 gamma-aminobutyric acid receptor subunit beta-like isoform X2 [Cylas formicarius]
MVLNFLTNIVLWLCFFVSLTLAIDRDRRSLVSDRLDNVTQTISKLLDGYDIRLRPDFGGEPLLVGMDLTIASFDAISEVNMDYTITLYLNQYWKDERLAFSDQEEVLTLSGDFAEKIWVPDTFFANDKNSFLHDVTERNKLVRLNGEGSITYGMRFTTTLACMMDLHYYPLDSQNCTVEIESYGYTVMDVVMYWMDRPVRGVEEAELPQFTIIGYETNDRKEKLATGIYQRLSLSFKLQRNIGYFIFQTYLPSILIVMLSWVSFWINHEATSARVALGITTVLTMTTISTGVRSSLPRISYVKAIDIYLVMCFVFVFAALLEYAAVNYTYWGARAKKKSKKNKEGEENKPVPGTNTAPVVDQNQQQPKQYTPEDIIELHDIRMSPIPSIRRNSSSCLGTGEFDFSNFPPSFRRSRSSGLSYSYRSPGLRYRGTPVHKPKVLNAIKKGALVLKVSMPKIKDVNVIDKYSRIIFPVTFMVFNAGYWLFYFLD